MRILSVSAKMRLSRSLMNCGSLRPWQHFDDRELDGIAGCESQVLQVVLRFGVSCLEDVAGSKSSH